MPFDYEAAKAQFGSARAREMEQEQGNMAPMAASLGNAMGGGGGFIPPEVMGGGGGVVNPGMGMAEGIQGAGSMTPMGMGNPGGLKSIAGKLGGGILGQVASRMSGVVGGGMGRGSTPSPAGPYGGIMGGQDVKRGRMNSTQPPPMSNGGVGGVAPRPAQGPMMRGIRGRGGMSMF